jgi:hypothetical protein
MSQMIVRCPFDVADRALTSCAAADRARRSTKGLRIEYTEVFDNPSYLSACELPQPDIIVDLELGGERELDRGDMLRRYGYSIIYEQRGTHRSPSAVLPGSAVNGAEFIAVKTGLLPGLQQLAPRVFAASGGRSVRTMSGCTRHFRAASVIAVMLATAE